MAHFLKEILKKKILKLPIFDYGRKYADEWSCLRFKIKSIAFNRAKFYTQYKVFLKPIPKFSRV